MRSINVLACLIVALLAVQSEGYTFLVPAKMSHPGVCYYNGMLLHPGHHNMATSCQSVHCNDDGSIIVEGCDHFKMHNCRLVRTPAVERTTYPECCNMNWVCMPTYTNMMINRLANTQNYRPFDNYVNYDPRSTYEQRTTNEPRVPYEMV